MVIVQGPNPDAMSAAWNMDYYRTAVWGRFQHLQSGETVCMFNTHYETPGKTEAQTQASNIILTRMASVCQPTDKLQVITGDFNAQPGEPAIAKLMAGGFAEPSKAGTYCGNMISPGCSSKFDFTFFKLATGGCYRTSEVLRTAFSGCYTSDHAPLLGTFCLGGSCCDDTVVSTSEPTPEPSSDVPTSETPEIRTSQGSGSGSGSGATGAGVVVDSGSAPGVFRSAPGDANMVPGTVDAANEGDVAAGGVAGGAIGGALDAAGKGETGDDAGVNAAGGSSSGDATRVSTSQSTGAAGAGGTVFAVLGVVGMVAAVAAVVARKKRTLDARLDGDKSFSAQAPGYFARGAGHDDLSPLPRISERPSNVERATNSPIPTLSAAAPTGERDSRSSSVSWKGGASPSVTGGDSLFARSTFDSHTRESRVNFSEADLNESYEAGHGALTKSARTDFAML